MMLWSSLLLMWSFFSFNYATTSSTTTKKTTSTTKKTTTSSTKSTTSTEKETTTSTPNDVITASPSNSNKHLTLIICLIAGAIIIVIVVSAIIVTFKYRYSMPTMASIQSFFNPNYNRFDDNNMVSLRDLSK